MSSFFEQVKWYKERYKLPNEYQYYLYIDIETYLFRLCIRDKEKHTIFVYMHKDLGTCFRGCYKMIIGAFENESKEE